MQEFKSLLTLEFSPYGALTPQQLTLLEGHYRLLLRWNRKMNLTRITGLGDAVRYHYCESLYLATRLPKGPLRIVDVGSGAGFPGIPVAILRPECTVELVESHQRKAVFLREAGRELRNVGVRAERAEELTEFYDWTISRAVSPEDVLTLHLSFHFAVLGVEGEGLPWGEKRALLIR